MFRGWRNMAVLLDYGLRVYQLKVIQACDAVPVDQVSRRDGRVGTIIRCRIIRPDRLVHRMEQIGTVHEAE